MENVEEKGALDKFKDLAFCKFIIGLWEKFKGKYPTIAQFLMFFIVCNGVTVLQIVLMPVFKAIFELTPLVDTAFRIWPVGSDGYYIFDYAAGSIKTGGGGGLAYFLAVYIVIGIAQVVNFFLQRNVTFKGKNNVWFAAMWYAIAFIAITIFASAAQGFYKAPLYDFFSKAPVFIPDTITMLINSAISFWVFFPIMKFIFKDKKVKAESNEEATKQE